MKCGIVVFPGSNCDRDVAYVTRNLLNVPTRMVWHQETDISDLDVIVLPGGFSYGDYLRCGALAQFSPVMQRVVEHAKQGKFVLGICNGFQILTETGLLPGALVRNRDLHFICDRVSLKVERTNLPWTSTYSSEDVITLPIAHGEGRYYAEPDTLKALEDNHQVLFRYCTATGQVDNTSNPNGSVNNIAGICDRTGRIVGMMPHPERASDPALGNTDGIKLFQGLLAAISGETQPALSLAL
ncbi:MULTISPECIES: phosphoribosylformylglycinamidine synthase subunit PurQ [unclassified Coleofasciculus]|uniref:phosphoribosylformylglycinamidine synthase subunit PurQ n=1 Tax=unclassified Coleofasciculus TaxID=2692782 RepID=UPI00187F9E77|nr:MULTISPECIES: phosphoribosylformylglycinamidine synthase subunit PurQ [unclassified Coleofasciculus]MBE9129827.1 phosphoribosylformylglycinamidine synthase subunit PurQ [Coleofasciculus sp. LEGE 07081]MBE9149136.1 phosphoribosylformylglycinamidine synthase subunit PurQ [Coleofasciculus sp. LEGE 07092]